MNICGRKQPIRDQAAQVKNIGLHRFKTIF